MVRIFLGQQHAFVRLVDCCLRGWFFNCLDYELFGSTQGLCACSRIFSWTCKVLVSSSLLGGCQLWFLIHDILARSAILTF
ncbi:hypothetical protein GUJ93_ZPchr0010g7364 [Zizania palustris]|uniref:Uncharacterized protein n=1 Tax=Zizania palustris TaxID=103762 RepID=A0A8J5WH91_ZIZPA|nr:hypothetical protein GUJ93_ZPchr0010g7364 [Zizania palustris]